MLVTFIRTIIIIITLMVLMRFMGKREIGEMQPYEFIITLIIADLACIPMADVSIPLSYGIIAILALFLLHQVLTLLEQGGNIIRQIISGKPSLVITKNGIDIKELKKNNLGISDLIESMRKLGYFSLDDLSYAIYEASGNLSGLPNPDRQNQSSSLPMLIIDNGKPSKNNLKLMDSSIDELNGFLSKNNCNIKSIEVLTIDGNGRSYLKEKGKKYQILKFDLKENIKW